LKNKSTFIVTPKGEIIKAYYNFKKRFIKSYTLGGVKLLRKWGWDIEKKKSLKWHDKL
jgi:hypothetical protein